MRKAYLPNRKSGKESLDYFPTPPDATQAFLRTFANKVTPFRGRVWEPACGNGYMSEVLKHNGMDVISTDIERYGYEEAVFSFLDKSHPRAQEIVASGIDAVITNPPYNIMEEFVVRAWEVSNRWIAMVARLQFMEGIGRYERMFEKRLPNYCFQYVRRVHMVAGRLPNKSDGGSSLAFCWLVWNKQSPPPEFMKFGLIDNRYDERQLALSDGLR